MFASVVCAFKASPNAVAKSKIHKVCSLLILIPPTGFPIDPRPEWRLRRLSLRGLQPNRKVANERISGDRVLLLAESSRLLRLRAPPAQKKPEIATVPR